MDFKIEEPGYLVRPVRPGRYMVAKFEDSDAPTAVYTVVESRKNSYKCGFIGCKRSRKCKHAKILEAWKALKKAGKIDSVQTTMLKADGTLF